MKTPSKSVLNHLGSINSAGGAVLAVLGLTANLALAQERLLHSFTGGATDGSEPHGTLALAGKNLYGMATHGGSKGFGTVFKVSTDGGSFTLLHTFTNGPADGSAPSGSPTLAGTTIYGLTPSGGSSGWGAVFRMGTTGADYTNLHSFANVTTDGRSPYGSLTLGGATLYGMTTYAGAYNNGVIDR